MNSGTPSLSYQVLALFDILPEAPIMIGITVTFEAPCILLISNARSWYLLFTYYLLLILFLLLLLLLLLLLFKFLFIIIMIKSSISHYIFNLP